MNNLEVKEKLIDCLKTTGQLDGKKIIAVCLSGSRLYNLCAEKSDYDFKVIYLPSKEDIYFNEKQTTHFSFDADGLFFDGQMISLKNFILDLGKPSLNSIEVLFDEEWLVINKKEDYANADFLQIYNHLRTISYKLTYANKGGLFNTIRGQMNSRLKMASSSKDSKKEMLNFMRLYSILLALEKNKSLKEFVITDGFLPCFFPSDGDLSTDLRWMTSVLSKVNDKEYAGTFNQDINREVLSTYHQQLMFALFKEDV